MRAAVIEEFGKPLTLRTVDDPATPDDGIVMRVLANGICRSDWHAWIGHYPDIPLPHVPGHEMAGTVEAVGKYVTQWKQGDRVTVPFAVGCGACPQCRVGHPQVCEHPSQPGFTQWGSFAELVAIPHADANLARLPDEIDFVEGASLGCRFITAYRAVVEQGRTAPGEWIAVHGCGGVGLSAIMIANAVGASAVAVDIADDKLEMARAVGAVATINATATNDAAEAVHEVTGGGAHVSLDALGSRVTCRNSVASLRTHGRHVQVGLMEADDSDAALPMDLVIARELEIRGSHGMAAHKYPDLFEMIRTGKVKPAQLIGRTVTLEESMHELETMNDFHGTGVTVIALF